MAKDAEGLTISEFARVAGVKPSFITQLINDRRIPEAVRDPDDARYRMPDRRCVIPSRYPRRKGKINDFKRLLFQARRDPGELDNRPRDPSRDS